MTRSPLPEYSPNLLGWISFPLAETLETEQDELIYGMSEAAIQGIIWTAFTTQKEQLQDNRIHRTDHAMFGTPPEDNRFRWESVAVAPGTSKRNMEAVKLRLVSGEHIYRNQIIPVYRDLGTLREGQIFPDSAVDLYAPWFFQPSDEKPSLIPRDRRLQQTE